MLLDEIASVYFIWKMYLYFRHAHSRLNHLEHGRRPAQRTSTLPFVSAHSFPIVVTRWRSVACTFWGNWVLLNSKNWKHFRQLWSTKVIRNVPLDRSRTTSYLPSIASTCLSHIMALRAFGARNCGRWHQSHGLSSPTFCLRLWLGRRLRRATLQEVIYVCFCGWRH